MVVPHMCTSTGRGLGTWATSGGMKRSVGVLVGGAVLAYGGYSLTQREGLLPVLSAAAAKQQPSVSVCECMTSQEHVFVGVCVFVHGEALS